MAVKEYCRRPSQLVLHRDQLFMDIANVEGCHRASALAALTLTAKGIIFLYFGEEIGLPSYIPETFSDIRDIQAVNHYHLTLTEEKTPTQAFEKALDECRGCFANPGR